MSKRPFQLLLPLKGYKVIFTNILLEKATSLDGIIWSESKKIKWRCDNEFVIFRAKLMN
tara:strand:- start:68255 stop:68431 length:177 start_codon:yes stop_codon:yes gene_type:complete